MKSKTAVDRSSIIGGCQSRSGGGNTKHVQAEHDQRQQDKFCEANF
jgi:hypothetical protein